jgi:predicted adenine nucleotide alpha hydrolase (AANH) superfamily ATPase
MEKLLLHTCCCPCFSSVFEQIHAQYALTLYFCNPNIRPTAEYDRRFAELKTYPPSQGILIIEGTHEFIALPDTPEGGERCRRCIEYRLAETARYAKNHAYESFATTLTVSPHKNAEMINELGDKLSKQYGIKYIASNFKKNNGYLRSLELSKQYNLYLQNYCGCTPKGE